MTSPTPATVLNMTSLANVTSPPLSCVSQDLDRMWWRLCDLELVWGVVGLGLAGFGFLLTSGLLAYFLATATYVVRCVP